MDKERQIRKMQVNQLIIETNPQNFNPAGNQRNLNSTRHSNTVYKASKNLLGQHSKTMIEDTPDKKIDFDGSL